MVAGSRRPSTTELVAGARRSVEQLRRAASVKDSAALRQGLAGVQERHGDVEPLTGQVVGVPRDAEALERWLLAELDQVTGPCDVEVHVRTRRGSPARELAAAAEEFNADALVIGALTTYAELRRSPIVAEFLPALTAAAASEAVTSGPLVSRTRATLRSAEFGFLGVVV